MPSLIPGYEYDIFISYRQKDNKYDGWVTEFVDNLKKELEATFKEEISVYFDINPHDGLLETHDVDASLKEKLKCLVFIPIISRTYCDPKSFAWEHEFKAFVEQASKDRFGLKIKLPNGNVANRVLPVRIHDLDAEDIKLCESVLGGVMRAVEFIYKEPGVDKPLAPDDNEKKNLNNTIYRIQIIKVAHAIKEIIAGIKADSTSIVKEKIQLKEQPEEAHQEQPIKAQKKPLRSAISILFPVILTIAILVIAAILLYPKIFKHGILEKRSPSGERITVAVMPFQNMTNDTIWDVWQDGVQNLLITSLSNSGEFKVRQTESINGLLQSKGLTNYASITPYVASSISQQLEANVVICGSINKAGSTIRVITKLIDPKTQDAFKAFQIECPSDEEMIFHIIDSLSSMVNNYLIISKLNKQAPQGVELLVNTSSPEAYRYYVYGTKAFFKRDYLTAVNWLSQSVAIDSNFNLAITNLSFAYAYLGELNKAAKLCLIAYKKIDQMPMVQKMYLNWAHAMYFETPYEEIKYLRQFAEFDDQSPVPYYFIGNAYFNLYQFRKAIPEFEKALDIYSKWGSKPMWIYSYILPATACHITGQYKKEKEFYKKAEHDFPGEPLIIRRQAILSFTEKDTTSANRHIKEYISICNNNSEKEAKIINNVAGIFSEAGLLDKAEEYYRKALSLEPDNPSQLNNLAWFLIDKDRNINEGMELISKALKLSPDDFNYIDTKGWGLYKQGRFKEAQQLLEICWNSRPIYSHEVYLHLEAAKKAVAGMK